MSVRQLGSRFPDKPKSKLHLMLAVSAGWGREARVCWNQGLSLWVREVHLWLWLSTASVLNITHKWIRVATIEMYGSSLIWQNILRWWDGNVSKFLSLMWSLWCLHSRVCVPELASDWLPGHHLGLSLVSGRHLPPAQLWLSPGHWAGTGDSACIKSLHYSSVTSGDDFTPWFFSKTECQKRSSSRKA